MKTTLLCLMAVMTADLPAEQTTIYQSPFEYETIIRGQNPTIIAPGGTPTFGAGPAPTYIAPGNGTYIPPGTPTTPIVPPQSLASPYSPYAQPGDPFLGVQPGMNPYGAVGTPFGFSGLNGPQPFRYGWTDYLNLGFAPKQDATGPVGMGDINTFEVDYRKEFITQGPSGWVWTFAPEFNYRSFAGPGAPPIASSFYRFAYGIKANSPGNGLWNWQFGFTPSIGTDMEAGLDSSAWMFDADAVLFSRISQDLQLVLGVSYWDRVDDLIVPQAGIVWTPNQFWEWRLVFPKPRVDIYLGAPSGIPTWFYVRGEYHVEAYQMAFNVPGGTDDQIQIEDWRAFIGLRTDNGMVSSFLEVGGVFGRDYTFNRLPAANFEADSSLMVRMGFRF